MTFFPNTKIKILQYNPSDVECDDYGEVVGGYTETEELDADFQPLSTQESIRDFGEILQDTYKLYLPLDTRIKPQDRILIDGITYAIIGTPMRMNHFIKVSHTKVIIQRFRKELE